MNWINKTIVVICIALILPFLFLLFFPIGLNPNRVSPLVFLKEIRDEGVTAKNKGELFSAKDVQTKVSEISQKPEYLGLNIKVVGSDADWIIVCTIPSKKGRLLKFISAPNPFGSSYIISSKNPGCIVITDAGDISYIEEK